MDISKVVLLVWVVFLDKDVVMLWNDECVEFLEKMWGEG